MKITGYRTVSTVHDWGRPVGDINGVSSGTRTRTDVLVLETDGGLEGIGVGSHRDVETVFPAIEDEDPRAVAALYDRMVARVFKTGHNGSVFATIGAVDQALWDLKAKMAGEPLWRTLGGRDRYVPGYASALEVALDDDALIEIWTRFADRGFAAGKLKGGRRLDHDLKRLGLMRDIMARNSSAPALMFDANESWHPTQAIRYVHQLESQVDLTWVEEPVRRWDTAGLRSVRHGIRAGVATGENLTGLEQFRALIEAGAVDVVQPGCGWGITHFLRVCHLAHANDLPVSTVGFSPALVPAAVAVPNLLTVEVQDLSYPLGLGIDQEITDGGVVLGDEIGNGISVDEGFIAGLALDDGWRTANGPHVRPARAGLRLVPEDDERPTDVVPRRQVATGVDAGVGND